MKINDRGEDTPSERTHRALSASVLLAIDVVPINDPPVVSVPTATGDGAFLTADEDRVGIVGTDCCGWLRENIVDATTISNWSVVLTDADARYGVDGVTPTPSYSRWTIAQGESHGTVHSVGIPVNDTMAVTITTAHGGILLCDARSEVKIGGYSAANNSNSSDFSSSLEVSGPMWAVAQALRGLRYRADRNWNSWLGPGGTDMHPIVTEVRERGSSYPCLLGRDKRHCLHCVELA